MVTLRDHPDRLTGEVKHRRWGYGGPNLPGPQPCGGERDRCPGAGAFGVLRPPGAGLLRAARTGQPRQRRGPGPAWRPHGAGRRVGSARRHGQGEGKTKTSPARRHACASVGELWHGRAPVNPNPAPVRVSGWRPGLLDLHSSGVAAGWGRTSGERARGDCHTMAWHRELSQSLAGEARVMVVGPAITVLVADQRTSPLRVTTSWCRPWPACLPPAALCPNRAPSAACCGRAGQPLELPGGGLAPFTTWARRAGWRAGRVPPGQP